MTLRSDCVVIFRHPFEEGGKNSRALMVQAASVCSGLSPCALGTVQINNWGKPFFPAWPQLHVSVTHSGSWWLCACFDRPVGLDLQIHRSYAAPAVLSRRFFHPSEDAFLARNEYRSFFDLWCAKESWVKYTGQGFFRDPDSFSVVSRDGTFPAMPDVQMQLLPFLPGYSLCLCTPCPVEILFEELPPAD